ncbi:MAG: hypothetical protein A2133_12805 [Actinobacteria bacterium RBG_16_64_13]|nr:MAG: hypothetical protein A2133_12805 [Actinobacteria bacterium RBG_16_64_13]
MGTDDPGEHRPDRRSSKREQAEEALRERQESLSSLGRHSPVYTFIKAVTPTESRIVQASDNYQRMIGSPGRDIVGKTMAELFPAEFAAKITADDWAVVSGGKVLELEEEFDGRSYTSVKFPIAQGDTTLLGGYTYDISERKAAEKTQRLTEFSINRVTDMMSWISPEGRFLFVNDSICRNLGYTRAELLDMAVWDVDPNILDSWDERWLESMKHESLTFESTHRTKGGEIFAVEVTTSHIEFEGQEYLLAFSRDIGERKRAEQERLQMERQLQHTQKLESLGVLAGGIAHDFNNILTSVLGNAELALSELSRSAPTRENLLEITASARRAAALCHQMLAYSGRGHFVTEALDLRALIEDMLDLLKSTVSKKAVLRLDLGKNLPPIHGDVSQISQVVMNLVMNASEAMGEQSGAITISTSARECSSKYLKEMYGDESLTPGVYLCLEVSDAGSGMSEATQERIFEPFFTTKFTGRGLGLAAVLGIVRGHKGALRLESAVGKGTTFEILFPASETDAALLAGKNGATESDWQGEGTILLVDDEETIRTMGERMLASLGFAVITAGDGREALARYAEHRDEISLVLLDLTMPRMDGEETFRELRLLDPEVRVIISSGYAKSDIATRFAGQGSVGFVNKPYSLAELTEQLRAAFSPRRSGEHDPHLADCGTR